MDSRCAREEEAAEEGKGNKRGPRSMGRRLAIKDFGAEGTERGGALGSPGEFAHMRIISSYLSLRCNPKRLLWAITSRKKHESLGRVDEGSAGLAPCASNADPLLSELLGEPRM